MKKKELQSLAKELAKLEKIISSSSDNEEVKKAKDKTIALTNKVTDMDDLMLLDDMIMSLLHPSDS